MTDEPRVIVAGAGPVGLTAAVRLASAGVPVTVLEQEPYARTDWRASTFHCSTLEVLEPTGIVPQMLAEGLRAPAYQLRDRQAGLVAEFDFALLADETAYPFRLQLNQQRVVQLLLERLARKDLAPWVDLRFGSRLVGFTQDDDGVVVDVEVGGPRSVAEVHPHPSPLPEGEGTGPLPEGEGTARLHGAFLFGADGASSTVRKLLGVSFEGMTYAERFLIVSIGEDLQELIPDLALVNYCADPEEWVFLLRTPESWRELFPIPPDEPDEVALSDRRLQERLQGVAPRPQPYTLLDRQIYRVHQRVAGAMRVGRVLLMGDAAHVNSPIGGVGLNSGIHDASDAAVRIGPLLAPAPLPLGEAGRRADLSDQGRVRVNLQDPQSPGLPSPQPSPRGRGGWEAELATYDAIRRRVALDYVQRDTHQNTLRMKEADEQRRWQELRAMAAIASDPERARPYLRRATLLEPLRQWGIGGQGGQGPLPFGEAQL